MTIYKDRVIGFVDILGWSNLIKDSARNENLLSSIDPVASRIAEVSEFCPQINEAYKKIIEQNPVAAEVMSSETDLAVTHFSDTIVLSASPNMESVSSLVSVVIGLSLVLLNAGYYVRGAIARGQLHHAQNSLYGPALITAYELEKNKALYPRVILTEEVVGFFVEKEWVKVDEGDGMLFLHVLHHTSQADIAEIERLLAGNIKRAAGDLSITQKLSWLRNYLVRHKQSSSV